MRLSFTLHIFKELFVGLELTLFCKEFLKFPNRSSRSNSKSDERFPIFIRSNEYVECLHFKLITELLELRKIKAEIFYYTGFLIFYLLIKQVLLLQNYELIFVAL